MYARRTSQGGRGAVLCCAAAAAAPQPWEEEGVLTPSALLARLEGLEAGLAGLRPRVSAVRCGAVW
jgi:hypothetical protein